MPRSSRCVAAESVHASPITSCPLARSFSATALPMYPVAPVRNTLMRSVIALFVPPEKPKLQRAGGSYSSSARAFSGEAARLRPLSLVHSDLYLVGIAGVHAGCVVHRTDPV